MTVGSWQLMGRAPTLAMAFATADVLGAYETKENKGVRTNTGEMIGVSVFGPKTKPTTVVRIQWQKFGSLELLHGKRALQFPPLLPETEHDTCRLRDALSEIYTKDSTNISQLASQFVTWWTFLFGTNAGRKTKGMCSAMANAMASVHPLPVKCHEPTVMGLAPSRVVENNYAWDSDDLRKVTHIHVARFSKQERHGVVIQGCGTRGAYNTKVDSASRSSFTRNKDVRVIRGNIFSVGQPRLNVRTRSACGKERRGVATWSRLGTNRDAGYRIMLQGYCIDRRRKGNSKLGPWYPSGGGGGLPARSQIETAGYGRHPTSMALERGVIVMLKSRSIALP
ncbi:hypothetical protein B0H11DRAFT_1913014 [Mycena galericulata]|nr:hypothetical protein B0H11DRAFT_1913014 [Mycena galericulata]